MELNECDETDSCGLETKNPINNNSKICASYDERTTSERWMEEDRQKDWTEDIKGERKIDRKRQKDRIKDRKVTQS